VDPEEQARREQERVIKSRERLKFRVYAAVRGVVLGTELFRAHPQLFEPDIFVNVYAHSVDVNTSLNEGQLRLLPVHGRSRALNRFAKELRGGIEKVSADLHLDLSTAPGPFGSSEPVMLVDVPCGYHVVLLRTERE
jgi:hypothetical protein